MPLVILAIFIGIPLIEIYLFIAVGGWIGVWPTIGLVILTALIGTSLLRQQGLATLARAQVETEANRLPVRELFEGVCLLFGGMLLLTPGFLTDAIGLALLLPQLRGLLGRGLWRLLERSKGFHFSVYGAGNPQGPGGGPGAGRGPGYGSGGPIIDGEEFGVERDGNADNSGDGENPPRIERRS